MLKALPIHLLGMQSINIIMVRFHNIIICNSRSPRATREGGAVRMHAVLLLHRALRIRASILDGCTYYNDPS